jgi:prevent-host-death family protein
MTNVDKTPPSSPAGGTWTLAVAKARLSEVVDRAQAGPQTITRNGKPSAVIVSVEEWAQDRAQRHPGRIPARIAAARRRYRTGAPARRA